MVSRRAPGGGGGLVGTPTYIPQNDPHDTLIILNIHRWMGNFFRIFFTPPVYIQMISVSWGSFLRYVCWGTHQPPPPPGEPGG